MLYATLRLILCEDVGPLNDQARVPWLHPSGAEGKLQCEFAPRCSTKVERFEDVCASDFSFVKV